VAPEPLSDSDPRSAPRCPHCGVRDAEIISLFGTQAISLQYRCRACGEVFEAVKYEEGTEPG
jgi:ring-1,2-phenylacetyl-CoA epoxidase subunit PaaD